jgi:glycogen debranching enzyme
LSGAHRATGSNGEAACPRPLGPDCDCDCDCDGYVEYERRNPTTGLVNQCWKDSWDSIQFAGGTLAQGPIATCEIQGYVYEWQRRSARLTREVWDDEALAQRLEQRAPDLRARFRRDFWIEERGCHALPSTATNAERTA